MEHNSTKPRQDELFKGLEANFNMLLDKLKASKDEFELQKAAIDLLHGPCRLVKELQPVVWEQIKAMSLEGLLSGHFDIGLGLETFDTVSTAVPGLTK